MHSLTCYEVIKGICVLNFCGNHVLLFCPQLCETFWCNIFFTRASYLCVVLVLAKPKSDTVGRCKLSPVHSMFYLLSNHMHFYSLVLHRLGDIGVCLDSLNIHHFCPFSAS